MKKILLCIVIGHSIKKQGARNKELNINEFFLNDELGQALAKECEKNEVPHIIHYRKNGYSKLPAEINKLNPSHTICIHHNSSSNKKVQGTETLFYKHTKVSNTFARYVNDEMALALGYRNRGTKGRTQGQNGGHVLRNTSMPCILLEPYFMSENDAVKNRDSELLAKAILKGYLKYIGYLG